MTLMEIFSVELDFIVIMEEDRGVMELEESSDIFPSNWGIKLSSSFTELDGGEVE